MNNTQKPFMGGLKGRVRWLPLSEKNRDPPGPKANDDGKRNFAARAGPPSPEKPSAPEPTTVLMIPEESTRRMTW